MESAFAMFTMVSRFILPVAAILFLLLCGACIMTRGHAAAVGSGAMRSENEFDPAILVATVLLTLIQMIFLLSLWLSAETPSYRPVAVIGALVVTQWIFAAVFRFQSSLVPELLAFFLTTVGLTITAVTVPGSLLKAGVCVAGGFGAYVVLSVLMRRFPSMRIFRYVVAGLTALLLVYNVLRGSHINGARNWLTVGKLFSFQPSEIVKAAFVFVGAVTTEQCIEKKHTVLFLLYGVVCMGCLAAMHDFGAVAIYFVTMMTVLTLRRTSLWLLSGISAAAVAGGVSVVFLLPYVASRFSNYRHVWENLYDSGYQQTRAMIAMANGGLFGLGTGNSRLQYVSAANTDLVFGVICEQWGLLMGLCVLACFVLLTLYTLRHTANLRYIPANTAAVLWLFQVSLNVFGTMDILPLTGVTLPFVSYGGSSMLAAWAILAYITATRGAPVALTTEQEAIA